MGYRTENYEANDSRCAAGDVLGIAIRYPDLLNENKNSEVSTQAC
ncbi:hypothetical protein [Levyella massiliensis]|nr:hypothetical protein [Levyella massiliensis]